jgi:hypothetical protein
MATVTTLENYDQRFSIAPLTHEEILARVERAQEHMARCTEQGIRTTSADDDRALVWLAEWVLGRPPVPQHNRCGYCFRAGGGTTEAWDALPRMSMDEAAAHAQVCGHNPLVQKLASSESENRALTSELEDLRGRKLGNADAWADAASESLQMYNLVHKLHDTLKNNIRALLKTELPAGELRRVIEEIVQ